MFGKPLDSYTLILSMAMLSVLLTAFSLITARSMPVRRTALHAWGLATLLSGVGLFLLQMRHEWSWFITSFIANTLVLLGAAYGLLAHDRLLDLKLNRARYAAPLVLGFASIACTHLFGLPQRVIVTAVSAAMGGLFAMNAIALLQSARTQWRLITAVSTATMLLLTAALLVRAFASAFGAADTTRYGSSTATNLGPFLLGLIYTLNCSLWIFDTVHDQQRRSAEDAAQRDGLTGLFNRSAFFELAAATLARQPMKSCALVMLDIDHFKRINDSMGHAAGDSTLAHAARQISSSVRLLDLAGRYGGEEFCILLPGCGIDEARELAERLVADAARQSVRLRDGRTASYTLSAGYAVAEVPTQPHAADELLSILLERADQALYEAKHLGRNRAVGARQALAPA